MSKKITKIAITGGKGGVGKSTVAVLMAASLAEQGKRVVLVDCDVECPNDYLLLGQKLKNPKRKVFAQFPKLNKKKCKKCGICQDACKNNAIIQAPGKYPIFIKNLCNGCGVCWNVCPFGAIRIENEEIGKVYLNEVRMRQSKAKNTTGKTRSFYLISGLAKEGLEETAPVVTQTKKFAVGFAERIKADCLLFDTAAGTHCPVINALIGSDFAFVVTEPTPMGSHDLEIILTLLKKLKIKSSIVLNQSDLGNKDEVEKMAKKFRIKISKRIPYSKEIVEYYSKGQILDLSKYSFLNLDSKLISNVSI
ncbi:ATP-binding protein [bacterium]|nr:ATP-binding protein [bacterium]